jgi:hypothetical protein
MARVPGSCLCLGCFWAVKSLDDWGKLTVSEVDPSTKVPEPVGWPMAVLAGMALVRWRRARVSD